MYFINDFCVVCLYKKNELKPLLEQDEEGTSYYLKLTTCFTQMKFKELDEQRCICLECMEVLNTVYTFFQTCVKSKTILLQCISKLSTICHKTGKMCVFSVDFKKNELEKKTQKQNEANKKILQNKRKRKQSPITKKHKSKENKAKETQNRIDNLTTKPSTSASNCNKNTNSMSERQFVLEKYNEIIQICPRKRIQTIIANVEAQTGVPKTKIYRIINESRKSGELIMKNLQKSYDLVESMMESNYVTIKKIIENLKSENGYPSLYQVYQEIKNHKNIPRMSQVAVYKIMKQIANESSNGAKSSSDSEDSNEENESNGYNNGDNYIEHIEVKPEITFEEYEEEISYEGSVDVKNEPGELDFTGVDGVEHINVGSDWIGENLDDAFHDPLSNEYINIKMYE